MGNDVYAEEVIVCHKERRGNGTSTPIRIITQVYRKDGSLIAERDPIHYAYDEIDKLLNDICKDVALLNNKNQSQFSITKSIRKHILNFFDMQEQYILTEVE